MSQYPSNDPRNRSNRRPQPARRATRVETDGRVYPSNDPRSRQDRRGENARIAADRRVKTDAEQRPPTVHQQWMLAPENGGAIVYFKAPSRAAAEAYCAKRRLVGTLVQGTEVAQ